MIVDLSHLLIDATNNGLNPSILLGAVPWELVVELHLSGIIEGPDGAFHDGHSVHVHEKVWDLLHECRNGLLDAFNMPIVTIEHSDPCWVEKAATHDADFDRLSEELNSIIVPRARADQANQYAKTYLKKLLRQWIPKLVPACKQRQLSFDDLVEQWVSKVVIDEQRRIALTNDEVPEGEREAIPIAATSFVEYARERLKICDAAST